jgi:DNA-binding CsgD family transcriptional regulator
MRSDASLLDQIYEASIIPEHWPTVCEKLSAEVNAFSTSVITSGGSGVFRYVCNSGIQAMMDRYSQSELLFQNPRPARHRERSAFSFLRDQDLMSDEELATDKIYDEFLRPLGLGYTVGDMIVEPSGHVIIFDILKQQDRGPFSLDDVAKLNVLKPDLARAALMSSRLAFQEAKNITSTLSSIGLPAAVVGDDQSVIAMNPEMEGMYPRIRTGARTRLSLRKVGANMLLQESLKHIGNGLVPSLQSIPVQADLDQPAFILHLLPVRRNARDVFSKSALIVIATLIGEVGPPDLRVISGLFDLTASEARVAREIAIGTSVEDIAVRLSVTRETVRTHLKHIYSKTGTARQSQLVILLSGLGAPHS